MRRLLLATGLAACACLLRADDFPVEKSVSAEDSVADVLTAAGEAYAADGVARTVTLAEGVYKASSGQTFPLVVPNGVSLKGAGMNKTVLDAENVNVTLVQASNTVDAEISGLSLRNSKGTILSFGNFGGLVKNVEIANCTDTGSTSGGGRTLYYSNGGNVRTVVFSGLVMTNISFMTKHNDQNLNPPKYLEIIGKGQVVVTNSLFRKLSTNFVVNQKNGHFKVIGNTNEATAGIDALFVDTTFEDVQTPGAYSSSAKEGGVFFLGKPTAEHRFERCVFRKFNNIGYYSKVNSSKVTTYGEMVICPHSSNLDKTEHFDNHVDNCLFDDIQFSGTGSTDAAGVIGGFRSMINAHNCTFHNCVKMAPIVAVNTEYLMLNLRVYNSSISECTKAANGAKDRLWFYNCNIWNTTYEGLYNANSGIVTSVNPYYADAENGDFHLTSRSADALIDKGDNSYVAGLETAVDLDRCARVVDGGSGTATVDLGCYEYVPPQVGGDILFDKNVYGIFAGRTVDVTATLKTVSPLTADFTASVAYSTNSLSGPATVTFPVGVTSVVFTVEAAADAALPEGEVATVTLTDPDGLLTTGVVDMPIREPLVRIDGLGARTLLRPGTDRTYELRLVSADFTAPAEIPLTLTAATGTSGNTFAFVSEGEDPSQTATIAAGASSAEAVLSLSASALGVTRATLSVGAGFRFAGFDSDTVELEILGYDGSLAVSPSGSDVTGDGTAGQPFGTVGYAAAIAQPGDVIRLASGTFTAVGNGGRETFPIRVPAGVAVVGVAGETVIDPAKTAGSFFLGSETYAAAADGGLLANVIVTNTAGAGVRSRYWHGMVSNCVFTALTGAYGATVGCYFEQINGDVNVVDSTFTDIAGAFSASAHTANRSLVNVPSGNTGRLLLKGCAFRNLTFGQSGEVEGGLIEVRRPLDATDCVFEDISVTLFDTTNAGKQQCSRGLIQVYSSDSNSSSVMDVDRCVFRRLALGYNTLSLHFQNYNTTTRNAPMRVSNSLFHDITGRSGVIGEYRADIEVSGCTMVRVPSMYSYATTLGYGVTVRVANTILSDGAVSASPLSKDAYTMFLVLQNVDLDNVVEGYGHTTNQSANVMAVAPGFVNADEDNYRLRAGSPLIDAGNNAYLRGVTDLEGNARVYRADRDGSRVDLGCYEYSRKPGLVICIR